MEDGIDPLFCFGNVLYRNHFNTSLIAQRITAAIDWMFSRLRIFAIFARSSLVKETVVRFSVMVAMLEFIRHTNDVVKVKNSA